MAGQRAGREPGGGAGDAAGARAAQRQDGVGACGGRGAGAGRAAGAGGARGAGAGRARAVRRARRRAHRGRGRPPPRRLQAAPRHAHHARDPPAPAARRHQLVQPPAAIHQKLDPKRHHRHQSPVHDREEEIVPRRGGVSLSSTHRCLKDINIILCISTKYIFFNKRKKSTA